MAIQLDLQESKFGISFTGAYFRIATASIFRTGHDITKHVIMIDIIGYATQPTENTNEIDSRRYHALLSEIESLEGATFLEKCYMWVMAQPDMAGSIAV